MSITVRGVIFAAPTAPGYAVGKRVVVTVPLDFTGPQIAAIDAAKGSEVVIPDVPFAASHYILTDGTQYANGGNGTVSVTVGVVQDENRNDGYRTFSVQLTDQTTGAVYHTGTAYLTGFDTIGSVFFDEGEEPEEANPAEPGYGLYTEAWNTKNFDGGIAGTGHNKVFAANPSVGWSGADSSLEGVSLSNTKLSFRFTGYVRIPAAGTRRFILTSRYGTDIGLWLDDVRVAAHDSEPASDTGFTVDFSPYTEYTEFQMVRIRLDYEGTSAAHAVKLEYQALGGAAEVIPVVQLYSGAQVGTITVVPPPDPSRWYIESVNRYEET